MLSLEDRLWSKVGQSGPSDCWEWRGAKRVTGYGYLYGGATTTKRWELAHRLVFQAAHGAIPDDLVICHHCDNPGCCNPGHLFAGTREDNNHDRTMKGRTSSRLKRDQVLTIRREVSSGRSQTDVARDFGVALATVNDVVRGKTWGWLPSDPPPLAVTGRHGSLRATSRR